MSQFPWKFSLLVALSAILWYAAEWLLTADTGKLPVEAVIGILSSRSNFEYRQAIRQTWLNGTREKYAMPGWFIVGRKPCPIPLEDRVDINSCTEWDPQELGENESQVFSALMTNERLGLHRPVSEGFIFKVHHPIVVSKLGYLDLVPTDAQNYTVWLKNAISEDIIVKITVTAEKSGVLVDGYRYLPVTPYLLPKGFEASVVIEVPDDVMFQSPFKQVWQDSGRIISFKQVFHSIRKNLAVRHSDFEVSAASIGFSVYDKQLLKEYTAGKANRKKLWKAQTDQEQQQLMQEVAKYKDIILIDVTDTYQNLPFKLLLFLKWIASMYKFNYYLKTDDDCILDVDKILHELKDKKSYPIDNVWWSRFRYNWLVDRVGKWSELDYLAPLYPPFGCGLGNILSSNLVHWLASNAHTLHKYQGEDVSLGIWLAAVLPKYIDDSRWMCDAGCTNSSFNVGQLKPEQIRKAWNSLHTCNSLCGC